MEKPPDRKEIARALGDRIRSLRNRKGLGIEPASTDAGISPGFLSEIENGKKLPSILTVARLAKAWGVRMIDFFKLDL